MIGRGRDRGRDRSRGRDRELYCTVRAHAGNILQSPLHSKIKN